MDIMDTIHEQDAEKEENFNDEQSDDDHEETGRAIRSDGAAPGGVDAVDREVTKNTTDQKDVKGPRRYTGRAGVATGGVDPVGERSGSGKIISQTDVQGLRRYPGRAGVAPGDVDSDGGRSSNKLLRGWRPTATAQQTKCCRIFRRTSLEGFDDVARKRSRSTEMG